MIFQKPLVRVPIEEIGGPTEQNDDDKQVTSSPKQPKDELSRALTTPVNSIQFQTQWKVVKKDWSNLVQYFEVLCTIIVHLC